MPVQHSQVGRFRVITEGDSAAPSGLSTSTVGCANSATAVGGSSTGLVGQSQVGRFTVSEEQAAATLAASRPTSAAGSHVGGVAAAAVSGGQAQLGRFTV